MLLYENIFAVTQLVFWRRTIILEVVIHILKCKHFACENISDSVDPNITKYNKLNVVFV